MKPPVTPARLDANNTAELPTHTVIGHEHASHPHFRFAVTAECLITDPAFWVWHRGDGSTSPISAKYIENQRHEEHALIYTDGLVAVTLYEHCYAMWILADGRTAGAGHWKKGEWRLTPESVDKIRKAGVL